jgi:hypothetical protein
VVERWKASRLSGSRRSSRSVVGKKASVGPSACSGIHRCKQARRRQRMSEGRRGGERRRHTPPSGCTSIRVSSCHEAVASFTRSFDSCASILTPHRGAIFGGEAVGRDHRWASSRKREEPTVGLSAPDAARLAPRHRLREEEGVTRTQRRRSWSPSSEDSRARVQCPHVDVCCRSR